MRRTCFVLVLWIFVRILPPFFFYLLLDSIQSWGGDFLTSQFTLVIYPLKSLPTSLQYHYHSYRCELPQWLVKKNTHTMSKCLVFCQNKLLKMTSRPTFFVLSEKSPYCACCDGGAPPFPHKAPAIEIQS